MRFEKVQLNLQVSQGLRHAAVLLQVNKLKDCHVCSKVGEDSSNRKFLVSRLFDVAEGSTLEESSSSCIRLEWNKGIVGHVAATGQPLNIKNAYQVRFCSVKSAGVCMCVQICACVRRSCDLWWLSLTKHGFGPQTTR